MGVHIGVFIAVLIATNSYGYPQSRYTPGMFRSYVRNFVKNVKGDLK